MKKLKNFIKENPIETSGAISTPKVKCKKYDDGDIGYILKVPTAPANMTWQKSAFDFVKKFQKTFGICPIYLRNNKFIINYCIHTCDAA